MSDIAMTEIPQSEIDDAVALGIGAEEEESMSCGEFCGACASGMKQKSGKEWAMSLGRGLALLATLYLFLFSLDLMGGSFKVLGGCTAGGLFDGITNPIAGLMIGILATVLVQSSSTSTSIVVSLVGSGNMAVTQAIPVIMGANIGTSVTNTIVSVGQIGNPDEFERAFAGATVHDMFNFLTVLVLLPIELITGVLRRITSVMVPDEVGDGDKWEGPLKKIVSPLVKLVLYADKKVISKVATGETTCEDTYAKVTTPGDDCNNWKFGLIKCGCEDDGVPLCPLFYKQDATQNDDMAAGGVALFISLALLVVALLIMVKLLQSMVLGTSERVLRKSTDLHPVLAIIVGALITILVQSSSVTTSVLTPLVGVGVLPLNKMLPLTIGANIGTTATALLASLVSTKPAAVQIALCHLFFNIFGMLIWYVIPFMRAVPLNAAKSLGAVTRRYRAAPLLYILFAFVAMPIVLLGISSLYEWGAAYLVLGVILTVLFLGGLGGFIFWWAKGGKAQTYAALATKQERKDIQQKLPEIIKELRAEIEDLKDMNKMHKSASGEAVKIVDSKV